MSPSTNPTPSEKGGPDTPVNPGQPDIRELACEVLSRAKELTPAEIVSILRLDQRTRWQAGDHVPAEEYLRAVSGLPVGPEGVFDLIYNEYLLREEHGEAVDLAEYQRRFPTYAKQLQQQVALHQALELIAPLGQPAPAEALGTGSDRSVGRPRPMPEAPDIPGYEIQAPLGSGGMGVVYQALELQSQRPVALKVIHKERFKNDSLVVQRFEREAAAAARLCHPNIVTVFSAGQVNGLHYLIMELVQGTDLERLMQQSRTLPIEDVCRYIHQAALGLQHAFERGVVHRDIKPANLILTKPEGSEVAELIKILDMGLVRVIATTQHDSMVSLTLNGDLVGTPNFMAPEQALNPHGVDTRADLYSLGCTFYFLLTGKIPFSGRNSIETIDMHRWLTPRPVQRLRSSVPAPVAEVVHKLMAKKPEERYRTPAELIAALEPVLARFHSEENDAELSHEPAAPSRYNSRPWFGTPGPVSPHVPSRPDVGVDTLKGRLASYLEIDDLPAARDMVARILRQNPNDSDALAAREMIGGRPLASTLVENAVVLEGHDHWVLSVVVTRDGKQAVTASQDHSIRVWDLGSGKELRTIEGHQEGVRTVALSPDGCMLLSGSEDRTVRLWELASGRELRRYMGWCGPINGVTFSPDGTQVLSAARGRSVHLWDVATGKELRQFKRHAGDVYCVAFPLGGWVLSGSRDSTLRVWSPRDGREQARFTKSPHSVLACATLPNEQVLVGCSDGSIYCWDYRNGRELRRFAGHQQAVTGLVVTPDQKQFLSVSSDHTARLWDVATGTEVRCLKGHTDALSCVAIAPDGRFTVTGSLDQTLRLWRLN